MFCQRAYSLSNTNTQGLFAHFVLIPTYHPLLLSLLLSLLLPLLLPMPLLILLPLLLSLLLLLILPLLLPLPRLPQEQLYGDQNSNEPHMASLGTLYADK